MVDKTISELDARKAFNGTQIVILNEEIYELSDARYRQIFRIDMPQKKKIHAISRYGWKADHAKICDKVRKFGKLIGTADMILRDD